jgi:hypothetical protein
MTWATDPVALLLRESFDPVDVLFRTQYYLAYDARLVKVPTAQRGRRHLRSATAAASPPSPSLLALRAALAARIVAEAPALLANYTLRLPGGDVPFITRRTLLAPAPAPHDSDGDVAEAPSPADALLRVSPAASALGLLGLDAARAGGWAGALSLALTWQVSAFTAQLADARLGAQLEATSRPAASAALFARLGIELDAGVNTRERLALRAPARASASAPSSAPPPPPPPAAASGVVVPLPALAGGAAALLSSLAAWAAAAGLPAASLAPLASLAAALTSRASGSNATSAAAMPAFVRRAAFVVSPVISLGLGQLAFVLPSDAAALAAALAAPRLASLLSAEVAFENSLGLWLDFAFVESAPLLQADKRLLPRHRRRLRAAPAAAIAPAAVLAAFRAALLDAASGPHVDAATAGSLVALFAALQGVEFTQLSFQLFTGAAALEALQADARPGVSALVEAQRFAILRTAFGVGTRLTARLVKQ